MKKKFHRLKFVEKASKDEKDEPSNPGSLEDELSERYKKLGYERERLLESFKKIKSIIQTPYTITTPPYEVMVIADAVDTAMILWATASDLTAQAKTDLHKLFANPKLPREDTGILNIAAMALSSIVGKQMEFSLLLDACRDKLCSVASHVSKLGVFDGPAQKANEEKEGNLTGEQVQPADSEANSPQVQ